MCIMHMRCGLAHYFLVKCTKYGFPCKLSTENNPVLRIILQNNRDLSLKWMFLYGVFVKYNTFFYKRKVLSVFYNSLNKNKTKRLITVIAVDCNQIA